MSYRLNHLAPDLRRCLVEYCAKALNHERYGTHVPFYLWAASNRREAETVLLAADRYLAALPPAEGRRRRRAAGGMGGDAAGGSVG
jgi:hypothetical protein